MRTLRIARRSALFLAAGFVCLPHIAAATTYTDASNDAYGDDYVDIQSVVVTNDSSNLNFLINLRSTSQIVNNTNDQYGLYEIGLQTGPGGSTAVENPYGAPIGISTGMNYWIGAWTNQTIGPPDTGDSQLYQYSGGAWKLTAGNGTNSPYIPTPVTLTDTSVEISVPLSSLGLNAGNSFNFDVWTTYGSNPSGQAAYDALDSGAAATEASGYQPWTGTPYDSATAPGSTFASTIYTMAGAAAPSLTWNNTGGSGDGITWDTANQNFNDGTNPAVYSDGANVTFNDNNNHHYTVNIPNTVNPASVTVDTSGSYVFTGTGGIGGSASLTKMGSGSLTISAPLTYTGATTISAGKLSLATNLTTTSGISVAANATLQLQPGTFINTATLTLASGATLDITTNSETFDTTVAGHDAATLLNDLKSAYDNGAWDLPGITSSTAAASHGITTLGYLSSGNTFTIAYTLPGDTNLNGTVDATDLSNLNSRIGWDDFNYDGVVNADDYALLMLGAAYHTPPAIPLPEPTILVMGIGVWIISPRRRRIHRSVS
jgi:autotransporter-associated beta strand protein